MNENIYTGSWERNNRSLTAAAIIALVGVGVFYFYVQSFLTAIAVVITQSFDDAVANEEHPGSLSNTSVVVLRVVVFLTQYACMLLPSWLIVRRLHTKQFFEYARLKKISFSEIVLAVAGAVLLLPASAFFSTLLVELLGIPEKFLQANNELFTSYTPVEFVWLIFGIAITPAICEEIFFRGHVQRTLERSLFHHSVWIVGIIFGLFHFQPLGLASLSLLGLYFGYLFYRSKSLYPSMAAHFTNNFLALLFTYQPFVKEQEWVVSASSGDLGLVAAGTIPFAGGVIFLFHKKTTPARNNLHTALVILNSREQEKTEAVYNSAKKKTKQFAAAIKVRERNFSIRKWKRKRMLRNR